MPTPQLVQGRQATVALKRGFDQIAELLAHTLGPTQGVILSQHEGRPAEILSDAAMIVRRIIALPNRVEDVGAMLARNLVWRQNTLVGDGCATTAVLAQAMLDRAHRFVAAGGNAMILRRGMDRATLAAVAALSAQAQPIAADGDLARVAETITGDEKLSAVLAEIFGKLGSDAFVTIEDYLAPYLERQYYEGGRFSGKLVSPYFITDLAARRAVVEDCHVALYAGEVSNLDDVQPLLEMVAGTSWHQVALIIKGISSTALTTLVLNHQNKKMKILGVELREAESKRLLDFDDLAVLTGATVLSPETGRTLRDIEPNDLGAAPRIEANDDELVIVAGEGDAEAINQRATMLRAQLASLDEKDDAAKHLQMRIARLGGQVAKLMIGAHTEAERNVIRQKAEKAMRALPIALREGVVAGGGVAYLNCIAALDRIEAKGDEAFGVQVIKHALAEPFRRIALNAGVSAPAAIRAEAQARGADFGYDAMNEQIVSMRDVGIVDAVGVLRQALQTAASGAVMALTTETIVLHENPETVFEP